MTYLLLTIVCNAIVFLVEFYLDFRQSRKLQESSKPPQKLSQYINHEDFEEMQTYSLLRLSFSRLESTYGFISEVETLLCGVLVWSNSLAEKILKTMFDMDGEYQITKGVMFLFLVSIFSSIMKAPFEIYRIYVIDSKFFKSENANQALAAWIADQIKMFALAFFVGVPLLSLILKLISLHDPLYWIYCWLGSAACAVIVCELYPLILAQIFNTVTILPDGELRTKMQKLAEKVNFPMKQIVYIDSSIRSGCANAFVMGVGTNKRIVLSDNLIEQLTADEVLAVVAHELGHYKNNHNSKTILLQIFSMGIYLTVLYYTIYNINFYKSFGFDKIEPSVGLCLFSYLYQPFGSFSHVLSNITQRHFEYMCDSYSMDLGLDMEQPLIKMHVNNVYNIVVDKHYSRYYNSHPSLMERLEKIEEYKKKREFYKKLRSKIE